MRFSDPLFFILLLFIPLFIYLGKNTGGRILFSSIEPLKKIKSRSFNPKFLLRVLRSLALVFLVCALARPQSGKRFSEISSEGVDIMLAIDTSGSMRAMDFKIEDQPTQRLDVVKKLAAEFIVNRKDDRVGLIVFGEEAFTQCPLTLDHGILVNFLNRAEIGMAGDATGIGTAVGVGVSRMKDLKAKSKVIILLTDGRNNAGRIEPIKAAELAQSFDVKVYTIGVGTQGQAPFLVKTPFGKQYVYQRVEIDEDTLKQIAEVTQAKYYRATDTESLRKIYKEIDELEKTEVRVKEYTEYEEIFHYFLFGGIFFLLLEIGLANTRLRVIP